MKRDPNTRVTNQRRAVLVEKNTQRALAARLVLHCLCFMIVGGLIAGAYQYLSNPFMDEWQLLEFLWRNFFISALAFVFLLPPLILDSLKLSHRIVGPICRLRKTMEKISCEEEVAPLKFRKGDYWQGMADEFNTMVAALQERSHHLEGRDASWSSDDTELSEPDTLAQTATG